MTSSITDYHLAYFSGELIDEITSFATKGTKENCTEWDVCLGISSILCGHGIQSCIAQSVPGPNRPYAHHFIIVQRTQTKSSMKEAVDIIIDPNYLDFFESARPTPQYLRILRSFPTVWIGTRKELERSIYRLTAHLEQVFLSMLSPLPPWRKASVISNHWKDYIVVYYSKGISDANANHKANTNRKHTNDQICPDNEMNQPSSFSPPILSQSPSFIGLCHSDSSCLMSES
eukprot:TRINITY_DN11060_c0_g1_i1.p1 TRINITY_DN11060_c0_g1~~TRINITY_DN11060_c0_g1_i1.p1  ORF type:complete len:231 (+),score=32.72 TRINITY_DN11060_c0_g1_i1:178-870(+)